MEENKINEEINLQTYPSVDLAYDIGLKSYDWAIGRMDAIDSTINTLLAWISSINLGVIAIIASKNSAAYFNKPCFYYAMIAFAVIILSGLATKVCGSLRMLLLEEIYDSYLHESHQEFKKDIFWFSGLHFRKNQVIVNRKGYVSIGMILCFIIEIIFIYLWLTSLN